MVSVCVSREHELVSGGCESDASFFVLKAVVSSFKENLLGCHVVAVEKGGASVSGLIIKDHSQLVKTQCSASRP
jgi:hypothetical protein